MTITKTTKTSKKKIMPSLDAWLKEAKEDPQAKEEGMYLMHNGVVRRTSRKKVRQGIDDKEDIVRLDFSFDQAKVDRALEKALKAPGIFHVRVWLNEGTLEVGDDIMLVLVGGDIRPRVIGALTDLVQTLKTTCVTEVEHTA